MPLCPSCWELRAATVKPTAPTSKTRLVTAGFILGCIALLPIPALQLAALIINIVALNKAKAPELQQVRWRAKVGLALTIAGLLIDAALFLWVLDSTPHDAHQPLR